MAKHKTAQLVKNVTEDFRGEAQLFKLSHDVTFMNRDKKKESTPFVVVSTVTTLDHGEETMIFPSDNKGFVLSWLELFCSRSGKKRAKDVLFELGDFHLDESNSNH